MLQISVIVPVYKVERYLDRCVESILAQTFKDFELILIDDGSPDNCPKMCDSWANKDNRIRVIHQKNGGLSAARNAAIDWVFANSDSEWITFIDSDDWVHVEYLERLYNAAVDNHSDVSICGYYSTEGEEPVIEPHRLQVEMLDTESFYIQQNVNAIIACGKLYHKNCFNHIRYPIGRLHEDEYVTYKIIFEKSCIAFFPAQLYYYFDNFDGITKSIWNVKRLDVLSALFEQAEYFHENKFEKAEEFAEFKYVCYFEKYINLLLESDIPQDKKSMLKKVYAKQMRSFLKKRKQKYNVDKYAWFYEIAYPQKMYIYWTVRAIKIKIKSIWS